MNKIIVYICAIVFLCSFVIQANVVSSLFQENDEGYRDWEKSVVRAVGFGISKSDIKNSSYAKIMARESAITVAQRRLLEIVQGVRIDSEQTVKNLQIESDVIYKRVNGLIRGARVVEERAVDKNTYMVTMELKFYGNDGIIKAIMPRLEEEISNFPTNSTLNSKNNRFKSDNKGQSDNINRQYTGIIIKVDKKLSPAIAPKVYNKDGDLIYGLSIIGTDEVVTDGLVAYNRTLFDAKNNPRIGETPLIIEAKDVTGEYNTDLILSNKDGRLMQSVGRNGVFKEAKVVIVIN